MQNSSATGLQQTDRKVVVACTLWALLAGMVLLLRAASGMELAWLPLLVSLLKIGSFLLAAALCWRSSSSAMILSGRGVWQAIAVGLVFYALGDITVSLWQSLWGITSAISLGDVFYAASYLFLVVGLFQALLPRRMTLNLAQTLGISVTGIVGILLASWLHFYYAPSVAAIPVQTQLGQTQLVQTQPGQSESKGAAVTAIASAEQKAPAAVQIIEQRLSRVASSLGLVYVAGDCLLVVIAVSLLVAYWGGSYSETWKLVAAAGLCLYVADMFLIYQVAQGTYRQGSFWDFFWILSALLFGLSAEVERSISENRQPPSARQKWR